MLYQPHCLCRIKLICVYLLVKVPIFQTLLPKDIKENLPMGWNNKMFWTAFSSGGTRVYFEYCCNLREPDSYEPKVKVDSQYQLTQEDIYAFYENGYLGPFDLISPHEVPATSLMHLLVTK